MADDIEAQVLVSLEAILEGKEVGTLEEMQLSPELFRETLIQIMEAQRVLAYSALITLRREREDMALPQRHSFDTHDRCMRCGKSRVEVNMPGAMQVCI